jgi:hypothetical protein
LWILEGMLVLKKCELVWVLGENGSVVVKECLCLEDEEGVGNMWLKLWVKAIEVTVEMCTPIWLLEVVNVNEVVWVPVFLGFGQTVGSCWERDKEPKGNRT